MLLKVLKRVWKEINLCFHTGEELLTQLNPEDSDDDTIETTVDPNDEIVDGSESLSF